MAKEIGNVDNKVKLYIQQGSDFTIVFDLSEFTTSLVDAEGYGQIRRTVNSSTEEAEFACTVNSGSAIMTVSLSAADSTGIVLDQSTEARRVNTLMCYDIELLFSSGDRVRLMWGEVEIIPEATII
jgi:hypothetical protein